MEMSKTYNPIEFEDGIYKTMKKVKKIRKIYKKIKDKITPEINAKVEGTLNEWFGVEYELVEV